MRTSAADIGSKVKEPMPGKGPYQPLELDTCTFRSEIARIHRFNEEFEYFLFNSRSIYINKDGFPRLRVDVYVV